MATHQSNEVETSTSDPEKPKARSAGDKRYRIELGCGSPARMALDRWRLFIDNWKGSSPVELLNQALDSLLAQSRSAEGIHVRTYHTSHTPLTMDTGSQYRLLDTIATPTILPKPKQAVKPSSPTVRTNVSSEKPIIQLANGDLGGGGGGGVRKRQQRRKKLVGVGTISENTKRILLEHIPDKKCVPSSEAEQDGVSRIPSPQNSAPPTAVQSPSIVHSSVSSTSVPSFTSSSLSSDSISALPNPVHSDPTAFRVNFSPGLSLRPGLLALPRPVFTHLHPEIEPKAIPTLVPVTSTLCGDTDRLSTVVTTPTVSLDLDKSIHKAEGKLQMSDEIVDRPTEMNQEGEGRKHSGKTVSPRRRGRLPGKNRRTRTVIPRKKKTKGLGGSISETTRRILLEHTSSDKASEARRLSETTRRILIEHTTGRLSSNTVRDTSSDTRGPQTIMITPSDDGRSLESTSSHQSVTFPDPALSQ